MYWSSILWFLSWPVVIVVAYQLIKFTLNKYDTVLEKPLKKANPDI
jgi:hypothetical protein